MSSKSYRMKWDLTPQWLKPYTASSHCSMYEFKFTHCPTISRYHF
jgi:hypothetical protein